MNPANSTKGYTFIELTVVIVLVGLMMTLAVPQIRYVILTDNLKSSTRKIIGIIKNLRSDAIREHKAYVLHFDLESNRFWIDSADMAEEEKARTREEAFSLPGDIRILDVWYRGKGKKADGETSIRFNEKGYTRQSVIHLGSEDGREITIVLRTFMGRVRILENYVEFENI